jgi:uncharacterized membrane protein
MPARNEMQCAVCRRQFPGNRLREAATVRPGVSRLIAADHPDWKPDSRICLPDLSHYRRKYVESLLEDERGELSQLDEEVLASLESGIPIAANADDLIEESLTFASRTADRVASFGGSWTFILSFCAVIAIWIGINVTHVVTRHFDPYPFILLNLVLSCVAALQAPIIMMSQRRLEQKDRIRAENDYKINLKSELEIRQLHEKLDHQLARQWQRLAEIQQIQIDMFEDSRKPGSG